jgi:hypothetical protein
MRLELPLDGFPDRVGQHRRGGRVPRACRTRRPGVATSRSARGRRGSGGGARAGAERGHRREALVGQALEQLEGGEQKLGAAVGIGAAVAVSRRSRATGSTPGSVRQHAARDDLTAPLNSYASSRPTPTPYLHHSRRLQTLDGMWQPRHNVNALPHSSETVGTHSQRLEATARSLGRVLAAPRRAPSGRSPTNQLVLGPTAFPLRDR